MITIGVLAVARRRNGGTLLYTLSMLDALSHLPRSSYRVVVFVEPDNDEYDDCGFQRIAVPGPVGLLANRILGRNPYDLADVILAPVYSMMLAMCGRPFAFTLHDLQERHYPENFGIATRLWRRLANWLLVRRARRVICESEFVKRDIVRYVGSFGDKIDVIPAPPTALVRTSVPDAAAVERVRARFGLPGRYLFYPAQFWPHKNHLRLVDAFSMVAGRHPDCTLVLTGRQCEYYGRVQSRIREAGIEGRVRHIGYVEQDELVALYRGATAMVMPTLYESISIPVYEAFALGCPVCVSNVVALPEQVGGAGLLFDPMSPENMAEKICRLLAEPDLRAELVAKGHRRIGSVTHEQYADRLRTLIGTMMQPTPEPLEGFR